MKAVAAVVLVVAVLLGAFVLNSRELTDDELKREEDKTLFERLRDKAAALGSSLREGIEARKRARVDLAGVNQPQTITEKTVSAKELRDELKAPAKVEVVGGPADVKLGQTRTTIVEDRPNAARETLEKVDEVRCATCEKLNEAREAGTIPIQH